MSTHQHRTDCFVCGSPLEYLDAPKPMRCEVCGDEQSSVVRCTAGHFVCDRCHSLSAMDTIERFCGATRMTDPCTLADMIMGNQAVSMHGPEHHYLVPAVLLACYSNAAGEEPERKREMLALARTRAEKVPGGFCGTHGSCGAALGAGIAVSIISGATPLSDREWRMSNRVTALALADIAEHGGPRCCKRDTFLALLAAVPFINKHFSVDLPRNLSVVCRFSSMNRECRVRECPFFA